MNSHSVQKNEGFGPVPEIRRDFLGTKNYSAGLHVGSQCGRGVGGLP